MTAELTQQVERKLRNRRRRAGKGKIVRLSTLVYEVLDKRRNGRPWDCMMRHLFGLPDREGREQTLVEGMLEVHTGMLVLKLPDATWLDTEEIANKIAEHVSAQKQVPKQRPIRMREAR